MTLYKKGKCTKTGCTNDSVYEIEQTNPMTGSIYLGEVCGKHKDGALRAGYRIVGRINDA